MVGASLPITRTGQKIMSDHAYRLALMNRALARSDAELFGHRQRYWDVAQRLAGELIAGTY